MAKMLSGLDSIDIFRQSDENTSICPEMVHPSSTRITSELFIKCIGSD